MTGSSPNPRSCDHRARYARPEHRQCRRQPGSVPRRQDLRERHQGQANVDGNGAHGYSHNGTLSWEDTWTTDYTVTSTVNAAAVAVPGDFNHPSTP